MSKHISKTLPITTNAGIKLNLNEARLYGDDLLESYVFAEPYPHIVIDNFLPESLANDLLLNFPTDHLEGDVLFKDRVFEHNKRQIFPHTCNQRVIEAFSFFNSSSFLELLESLTNIKGLIPDPHFSGGGFHEIFKGGLLGVHADFRIQERLHLNRRINVLIYLNKNWQSSYLGNLELWDSKMTGCVKSIEPLFNRCVIFNTDADSYHGHPDALNVPEGVTRKSIALYYYTASMSVYDETPNLSTVFKARSASEIEARKIELKKNKKKRSFLERLSSSIKKRLT